MICGPTGLAPAVTMDTTKINTVNYRTSNLAPVTLNSQITAIRVPPHLNTSTSRLTADIFKADATPQLTDKEIVKTDRFEQSALDTDQLGLSIVEADIPCTNAQDDTGRGQETFLEMTTVVQESIAIRKEQKFASGRHASGPGEKESRLRPSSIQEASASLSDSTAVQCS